MASHCSTHWELYLKTLRRLYFTPFKLAKFYPACSPTCWRLCGENRTLAHTLWFCKSLRSYWCQIFSLICDILGQRVDPNLALALIHIGVKALPPRTISIIIHLLLATKLNITRLWRTTTPPSISNMISDLNLQSGMEKMLAFKNLQTQCSPYSGVPGSLTQNVP